MRRWLIFGTPIGATIKDTVFFDYWDTKEQIAEKEQKIIKHRESQGCKLIGKIF